MKSYDVFVREIVDIRRWLFTTIYSYAKANEIISEKIQNGDVVAEQVARAFNEDGCNEASLVRRLSKDNIKICKELALIRSISALEVFTIDSVKEVFNTNKSPFLINGTIEYSVGEFLSCDNISELHSKYIEKKCRNLHSGGFEDIEKYYKKIFSIDFSSFSHQIDGNSYGVSFLKHYHQKRHLIVHRLGKTDEQYRKKYNTQEMTIKLDECELSKLFQVMLSFAYYLKGKMSNYIMTPPVDNIVEIVVQVVDENVLEYLEPSYAIKLSKNKVVTLSSILKAKEMVYADIYKITLQGPYHLIRKYYKVLKKMESAEKVKGLCLTNISLSPIQRKSKQYSWDDIEKVLALLPEKPWQKHIHKDIAAQLGWANNKVSGIISYIVNEKPINISLGRSRLNLCVGETYTFTPVIEPAELLRDVILESGDLGVVEVDNMTVTAVAEGITIITVRVQGYAYKTICNVTVVNNTVNNRLEVNE